MNEIEKLKEENKKLKARIKKYAELNEIDTKDYAALHNENAKLNAIIDSYQPRLQRYKDILQEIKELAESVCRDNCPDLKNGYCIGLGECSFRARKQIIDLITKAEGKE